MTFGFDPAELSSGAWMHLGEVVAKLQSFAGAVLRPAIEQELLVTHEATGIHGTVALAGNSLDAQDVRRVVDGTFDMSPGQGDLVREVENMHDAHHEVIRSMEDDIHDLTTETICDYNARVLDGLPLEAEVTPGEIRSDDTKARRSGGVSFQDCRSLLDRLCCWLNGPDFAVDDDPDFYPKLIARALLAHLYLARIRPFEAGNGRTARLLEFRLMAESGIPLAPCHLLSGYYYRTRTDYETILDGSGRTDSSGSGEFLFYALRGWSEGLDEIAQWVLSDHELLVWDNIVYGHFADQKSPAALRREELAQGIPPIGTIPDSGLMQVPAVARAYSRKNPKTLARDLDLLEEMGLLIRTPDGYSRNLHIMTEGRPRTGVPTVIYVDEER